ncbi:MAG: hypothetical protein WB764_26895 [Xanthobacteraceae bacterium]
MWWRVLLVGALLAGALGACAVVDPVDNRYDTVSRSLAKARNESIFLNLVRASHDYPLSFTVVANVTPSLTNTTSFSLPSFLLGPSARLATGPALAPGFTPGRDVIFGNTTAGNTTAVSTNFSVSTQETSAFYQGFLKPIDLQTLAYFIRQGYSRELLFWLFTDAFTLTLPGQPPLGYHYSPPDDYGCSQLDPKHRCFIDWVHNAAFTGLTVEEKTEQASASSSAPKGGAGTGSGGSPKGTSYARFCFNPVLAQQAVSSVAPALVAEAQSNLDVQRTMLFSSNMTCGSDSWTPEQYKEVAQPDILPLTFNTKNAPNSAPISFSITPRSAYGVFVFLGTLMRMQREHLEPSRYAFIPPNRPYATEPPLLETVHEDPQLMTVVQNMGGECFVHTWFADGDYCVPEQAATTKRIFGLLAQLIAIQTAAADLSITPVVRVIQ